MLYQKSTARSYCLERAVAPRSLILSVRIALNLEDSPLFAQSAGSGQEHSPQNNDHRQIRHQEAFPSQVRPFAPIGLEARNGPTLRSSRRRCAPSEIGPILCAIMCSTCSRPRPAARLNASVGPCHQLSPLSRVLDFIPNHNISLISAIYLISMLYFLHYRCYLSKHIYVKSDD